MILKEEFQIVFFKPKFCCNPLFYLFSRTGSVESFTQLLFKGKFHLLEKISLRNGEGKKVEEMWWGTRNKKETAGSRKGFHVIQVPTHNNLGLKI
jgi:hypothetical protein